MQSHSIVLGHFKNYFKNSWPLKSKSKKLFFKSTCWFQETIFCNRVQLKLKYCKKIKTFNNLKRIKLTCSILNCRIILLCQLEKYSFSWKWVQEQNVMLIKVHSLFFPTRQKFMKSRKLIPIYFCFGWV